MVFYICSMPEQDLCRLPTAWKCKRLLLIPGMCSQPVQPMERVSTRDLTGLLSASRRRNNFLERLSFLLSLCQPAVELRLGLFAIATL